MKALVMLTFIALICGCTYEPLGPDTHVPWIRRPPDQLPDLGQMAKSPNECGRLDLKEKDECLILAASLARDLRICTAVSTQWKDSCILAVGTGSSNLIMCDLISNKRLRQECKAKSCEFGGYVSPLAIRTGPTGLSPDLSTPETTFRHIIWTLKNDDRASMKSLIADHLGARSFMEDTVDPKGADVSMSETLYNVAPKDFRPVLVWSGSDDHGSYKVMFLTFPPDDTRSSMNTIYLVLTDKAWKMGEGTSDNNSANDPGPIPPSSCVILK